MARVPNVSQCGAALLNEPVPGSVSAGAAAGVQGATIEEAEIGTRTRRRSKAGCPDGAFLRFRYRNVTMGPKLPYGI